MAKDRASISENNKVFINDLKESDLFGFSMMQNKDAFLFAVALGIDSPKPPTKRDGLFLFKDLKTNDSALLKAVLLGTAESGDEIDALANFDKSIDLCEECAERGFEVLRKKLEEGNRDKELIERRMLKELDLLYSKNVDAI